MDKLLMGNSSSEADDDAEPEFDFPSYLHLISRLRSKVAADKRDELQEVFAQYDKDHSGDLSMREVSLILLDLGLQPKTRAEQEEIQHMRKRIPSDTLRDLFDEVDVDGSGVLEFTEFLVLMRKIEDNPELQNVNYETIQNQSANLAAFAA